MTKTLLEIYSEETHECTYFVSVCCGTSMPHPDIDICGACLEHSGFECYDCGKNLKV
jgi:hypothetical protein